MTFEEYLKSLELTDEQVEAVTAGMAENKFFLTNEENGSERLQKMKEQRDAARAEAKESADRVVELEAQATENQETLASIEDLKTQLESANKEKSTLIKTTKLEKALAKAGANDIDYLKYKLGGVDELELDDKGEFTDFDNKLKDLKEKLPKYFESDEPDKNENHNESQNNNGFKTIDTQLKDGKSETLDPFDEKIAKYQTK